MTKKRVAVLISGRGSNMMALIEAAGAKDYPAEIVLVLSNRPDAAGLKRAQEAGTATVVIDHLRFGEDREAFERALSHLAPHLEAVGASKPQFSPYKPLRFEDQVRVLLDAKVLAFSFIYGIPPKEILEECHRQGILTIGTATTRDEAIALGEAGVDVVVASGFEAGGNRGSFLRSSEDSLTGTISLVPQIVDAVGVPVVAAGGIADARGIAAAFRARWPRCADGDGLSCLRRVWSNHGAPGGDPERKGEPSFAYT